jgi:hypothetical protein
LTYLELKKYKKIIPPAFRLFLLEFEEKDLRTICGPKIENGVYRRRYNHELDKEFTSPNAIYITKTSRLRYAGHMIRRPDDLPQRALFKARPNGRRNQGRPKSKWSEIGRTVLKTGRHGKIFFNRL